MTPDLKTPPSPPQEPAVPELDEGITQSVKKGIKTQFSRRHGFFSGLMRSATVQNPVLTPTTKKRQMRHELKFIINYGTYVVLMSRLRPILTADLNGDGGEYRVTSLYFDDIYNSAYLDKTSGILNRRKFRVRAYNLDNSIIKLEAKHKDGEYVSKISRTLTKEQYMQMLCGDYSFMHGFEDDEGAFGEFYRSDKIVHIKPKVIVDYRREAYIYPFGNVRITFDKKLSTCYNTINMFAKDAQYSPIYDKDIILEVKFDNYLPSSIQAMLQGLNAAQQSVSKYIICCDKLMEVKSHDF